MRWLMLSGLDPDWVCPQTPGGWDTWFDGLQAQRPDSCHNPTDWALPHCLAGFVQQRLQRMRAVVWTDWPPAPDFLVEVAVAETVGQSCNKWLFFLRKELPELAPTYSVQNNIAVPPAIGCSNGLENEPTPGCGEHVIDDAAPWLVHGCHCARNPTTPDWWGTFRLSSRHTLAVAITEPRSFRCSEIR